MLLGIDSTDSVGGGCTTHVAARILAALSPLAVRQAPRLVRLNPNIPYKTRGNGAIAFELGHARGGTTVIGEVDGTEVRAAGELEPLTSAETRTAFETASRIVASARDPSSNSGLIGTFRPLDPSEYWSAVQRHVDPPAMPMALGRAWGDGRGLIGARAAAAWPGDRGTWEAIGYRRPDLIGTRRTLRPTLGPELDAEFPTTFDNWDPRHGHLRIAPASPCPILAGVRATDAAQAMAAVRRLGPETPDSWLLFWTNQATGDHLRPSRLGEIRPYDGVRVRARACAEPRTRAGGHVLVDLEDDSGRATAIAYEPTKEFRDAVRQLRQGDEVEVEAGAHDDPSVLALEAFTVVQQAELVDLVPPPCGACGRAMKSEGRRGGYRCGPCGARAPADAAVRRVLARGALRGRFTVPILVRRHLARPNGLADEALRPRPPIEVAA